MKDGQVYAEDSSHNTSIGIITAVIIIAAAIIIGVVFLGGGDSDRSVDSEAVSEEDTEAAGDSLGESLYVPADESIERSTQAVPETNPFAGEGVNPYEAYQNPFE